MSTILQIDYDKESQIIDTSRPKTRKENAYCVSNIFLSSALPKFFEKQFYFSIAFIIF